MENVAPQTAETLAFEPLNHRGGSHADIPRRPVHNSDNVSFILRLLYREVRDGQIKDESEGHIGRGGCRKTPRASGRH